MVADGRGPSTLEGHNTIAVTRNEQRLKGKAIQLWSPRAQPRQRDAWRQQVHESMRTAQPQVPRLVLDGPPTLAQIQSTYEEYDNQEQG